MVQELVDVRDGGVDRYLQYSGVAVRAEQT